MSKKMSKKPNSIKEKKNPRKVTFTAPLEIQKIVSLIAYKARASLSATYAAILAAGLARYGASVESSLTKEVKEKRKAKVASIKQQVAKTIAKKQVKTVLSKKNVAAKKVVAKKASANKPIKLKQPLVATSKAQAKRIKTKAPKRTVMHNGKQYSSPVCNGAGQGLPW